MSDVTKLNLVELSAKVLELAAKVLELETKVLELSTPKATPNTLEMTKEHALRVLNGDLAGSKHKDAAASLGLTYGQVYSCRLEFTFKDVHKALKAEGWKNSWTK